VCVCVCVCVYFRSTEEIFALFISMAFAFDAFKDVLCGMTIFQTSVTKHILCFSVFSLFGYY